MREEELYERWFAYARSGQVVISNKHRLRIIEPGVLNRVRGPDILSARFELDGTIYQGAVEFHSAARDWYRHGHHLDHSYAGVLLHLCGRDSVKSITPVSHTLHQQLIPTLSLPPLAAAHSGPNCGTLTLEKKIIAQRLMLLARERLGIKIRYFSSLIEHTSAVTVFYRHFFRVLGFPNNNASFQMLALKVEWAQLQRLLAEKHSAEELLAVYMGQAGLFPLTDADAYTQQLKFFFNNLKVDFSLAPMQRAAWTLAGTRYHNHPHLRLAGWVELLRQRGNRPDRDLHTLLASRLPLEALRQSLQSYFCLPPGGYWQNHYALGRPVSRKMHTFFGRQRVDEILFNLLIPFYSAGAGQQGSMGFSAYLEDIYLNWLSAEWYGFIPRRFPWAESLFPKKRYAAYNQGFIRLERAYCRFGFCNNCPLKRKNFDIKQLNL